MLFLEEIFGPKFGVRKKFVLCCHGHPMCLCQYWEQWETPPSPPWHPCACGSCLVTRIWLILVHHSLPDSGCSDWVWLADSGSPQSNWFWIAMVWLSLDRHNLTHPSSQTQSDRARSKIDVVNWPTCEWCLESGVVSNHACVCPSVQVLCQNVSQCPGVLESKSRNINFISIK